MENENISIYIRMTASEKEHIQSCANELGISVNAYLRYLARTAGDNGQLLIKTNDLTEFTSELALMRKRLEAILHIVQLEKTISSRDLDELKLIMNSVEDRCAEIQRETFNLRKREKNKK